MSTATSEDARWMRRAVEMAEVARSVARPNPPVGALVVAGGEIVAEGATRAPGAEHAEIVALDAAGPAAKGATLVVTLEPCAHHGRTPPCTDAIVAAGITRVVIGHDDPNPVAAGGGDVLRHAGLEVVTGVLADRVRTQLTAHLAAVTLQRPHVVLKIAQDARGRTSPASLDRDWITGRAARTRVHELRARVDAVMVGSGTVLADDPRLTVRHVPPAGHRPRAVVWDRRGRTPTDATVVRRGTVVLTSSRSSPAWRDDMKARDVDVVVAGDIAAGLQALVDHGITALLAEPGPRLGTALLGAGAVDRVLVHVAETSLDDPAPRWALPLDEWRPTACRQFGGDVEWDLRPAGTRPQQT